MLWNKLKVVVVAAMLATGLAGFTVGRWASADPSGPVQRSANKGVPPVQLAPPASTPAKPDEAKPPAPGRRREAVIRVPVGTFVKEVEVAPYGSGRLTWTFEEDRILGTIEASVMGFEVELATEAEFSLSSNGTIYGIITGVKLSQLRIGGQFAELQQYAGLWPLVEPLVAEMLTDLPFSYQFRQSGDRLSIHNFRMLLAGPNPLGKLGTIVGDVKDVASLIGSFAMISVAVEGTYMAADGKEAPKPRPKFKRAGGFPAFSLPVQPVVVAAPHRNPSATPAMLPAMPPGVTIGPSGAPVYVGPTRSGSLPPVAPTPTGKPAPATSNRTPPVPATLPPAR
jgi:hypothetical protein